MPLSEDERRILSEIEQQLYASDPNLADHVATTTVYSDSLSRVRWALVGFVVCLFAMITLLWFAPYWVAFLAFLGMFAAGLTIDIHVRRMGRAGLRDLGGVFGAWNMRDYFLRAAERARERTQQNDGD